MPAKAEPAPAPAARTYTIAAGDTLTKISQKFYGTPSRWPEILAFTDHAQLTLALGVRVPDALPPSVRTRVARNLTDNAARHQHLLEAHRMLADGLHRAAIPFVLLKGISNWPGYCERPEHRPQSDIDIFCPPELCQPAAIR